MKTLDEIKEAIRKGLSPEEGLKALTDYVETHPGDDEALTARGMQHWSMGDRASAINDYLAAIKPTPKARPRWPSRPQTTFWTTTTRISTIPESLAGCFDSPGFSMTRFTVRHCF